MALATAACTSLPLTTGVASPMWLSEQDATDRSLIVGAKDSASASLAGSGKPLLACNQASG